jgi:hypothetical protein
MDLNLKIKGERNEDKSKVVVEIKEEQTRATTFFKKLRASSYDI